LLQPGLTGLSIGFTLVSGQPTLRAQIAGLDNPVPLSLLGEGSARLTEILLAPPTVRAGLLLVDEVENGLYYRNMETAWRAIDAASSAVGTQVFATTHNAECVQAAVRALNGASAKDFRLYRLERADDSIRVVTYDHETAEAAFDFELEFR
jgi:AAA15 family ATPase/GTPase